MVDDFKLEKLKKLQEQGINPYPYSFKQKAHAEEIKKNYDKLEGKDTSVAGRALSIRHMGQLYFIDLLDQSGKIQVLAAANVTEKKSFDLLESIDSGDMLGIEGKVNKTKRGEISIEAKTISMLGKSLRQLPEKFHGLNDTEIRYRKRYLDLVANPESMDSRRSNDFFSVTFAAASTCILPLWSSRSMK